MRAVRSEREDQLYKQFMSIDVIAIVREAVLSAQLAELAWPIREHNRTAFVGESSIPAAVGVIVASTQKPAAPQLIIRRSIVSESFLSRGQLLAIAPDELAAADEGVVNRAAQRLPAQRGIDSVELGKKVRAQIIVAACVRNAQIQVRRFIDIAITAQMGDGAHIAALR